MYFELLRPYFLMLCPFCYAQIIIGFRSTCSFDIKLIPIVLN
jgi:hypothetical protein